MKKILYIFIISFFVNTSILCKESSYVTIINSDNFLVSYLVEVMRSDLEQQRGMMYRKSLDKNNGMLFLFKKPKSAVFWMKNTYISLDMIFIKENGFIDSIYENLEPLSLEKIKSRNEIIAVLEIPGGDVKINKINMNSKIILENLD